MSYIKCGSNGLSTYCPDTPQNWKEFYELKARITGQKIEQSQIDAYTAASRAKLLGNDQTVPHFKGERH